LRPDERADIGGGIASGAEAEFLSFFHAAIDKCFADGLFDEEAFDGKADLAAIGEAAPDGAVCGDFEVGVGQDEHGVFAAEFENGGDEFFCAGFGDAAPGRDAAREHDFVGSGVDQGLTDFACALDYFHEIVGKTCIDEDLFDERAALRGEVAGFANDGVARGDGGDDLAERDGQRIVPGTDDADDAEWFVVEAAGFGSCGEAVVRDAFWLQETRGILREIFGSVERDE